MVQAGWDKLRRMAKAEAFAKDAPGTPEIAPPPGKDQPTVGFRLRFPGRAGFLVLSTRLSRKARAA